MGCAVEEYAGAGQGPECNNMGEDMTFPKRHKIPAWEGII